MSQQCYAQPCKRQPIQGGGYCEDHKFLDNMYPSQQAGAQLALHADTNALLRELISKVDELIIEMQMQRIRETA